MKGIHYMRKKVKKAIMIGLVLAMLMASSLSVYAACVTHVSKDRTVASNWEYVGTVNSFSGTTHPYPLVIDGATGEVLKWGTCQTVVYVDKYVLRCRNCTTICDTELRNREVHTVPH